MVSIIPIKSIVLSLSLHIAQLLIDAIAANVFVFLWLEGHLWLEDFGNYVL